MTDKLEKRKCRGCDQIIAFVRTVEGKIIPLDVRPASYSVALDLAGHLIATPCGESVLVSHFLTCKNANKFSGKNK